MDEPSLSAKGGCPGAHRKHTHREPAPEPDTPQHKRRRSDHTADELAEKGDDMVFGVKRRKRSSADNAAALDPAEGPSAMLPAPTNPPSSLDKTSIYGKLSKIRATHRSKSLDNGQSAAPSTLSDMLERSEAKIVRLEADLLESRQYGTQVELRAKQDMLLDIFREQEKRQKVEFQLAREKKHVIRLADHYAEKIKRLEAEKILERSKFLGAQQEANNWRLEVEHYQTLTGTLEQDIDELRQIENAAAAAAKEKQEARSLPPAYGSLDDEDRFPPYGQCTDGGTLEIATIKREVRATFQRKAEAAQAKAAAMRSGSIIDQAFGESEILRSLSEALVEACARVHVLLNRATQVLITRHHPLEPAATSGSGFVTQHAGNAPFVPDRLAKLIIDLCWRTLSTMDIRPTTLTLSPTQKSNLACQHTMIDDALLVVIQASFRERRTLLDLQYYLTQLIALRAQFLGVRTGISYMFFHKCTAWLADQVEKERELAANRDEVEHAQEDQQDDISSQWPDSPRKEDDAD